MTDALGLWALAVFVIGGAMYVVMSLGTRSSATSSRAIVARRPGWIARRRARRGIRHRQSRIGVGYVSGLRAVHLTAKELAGHGLTVGGPGSGKTTFLQLLVEASAGRMPVVLVDPKGSPALEATVRAHGGQVWTLDGRLPAELLDPRPWQVADQLLEGEDYSADARAYRDAAQQRALWAAWALVLAGAPMDLARLRRLLDRGELLRALEPHRVSPTGSSAWSISTVASRTAAPEASTVRWAPCWTARRFGARWDPWVPKRCASRTSWTPTAWCCSRWTPLKCSRCWMEEIAGRARSALATRRTQAFSRPTRPPPPGIRSSHRYPSRPRPHCARWSGSADSSATTLVINGPCAQCATHAHHSGCPNCNVFDVGL